MAGPHCICAPTRSKCMTTRPTPTHFLLLTWTGSGEKGRGWKRIGRLAQGRPPSRAVPQRVCVSVCVCFVAVRRAWMCCEISGRFLDRVAREYHPPPQAALFAGSESPHTHDSSSGVGHTHALLSLAGVVRPIEWLGPAARQRPRTLDRAQLNASMKDKRNVDQKCAPLCVFLLAPSSCWLQVGVGDVAGRGRGFLRKPDMQHRPVLLPRLAFMASLLNAGAFASIESTFLESLFNQSTPAGH
jgi:hypothetical protein